jgi:hypothetical protein
MLQKRIKKVDLIELINEELEEQKQFLLEEQKILGQTPEKKEVKKKPI